MKLRSEAGVEYDINSTGVINSGLALAEISSSWPNGKYKVEIKTIVNGQSYSDVSDNYFTITSLTTTCAQDGERVFGSETFGPTQCCNTNAGIKPNKILYGDMCVATNDGSKGTCVDNWWRTCGDGVCGLDENKCNCQEDCLITTNPSVTMTSPNGGEAIQIGSFYNFQWTAVGVSDQRLTYKLALINASGVETSLLSVSTNVAPSGSLSIKIPTTFSAGSYNAKIYYTLNDGQVLSDESNAYFNLIY